MEWCGYIIIYWSDIDNTKRQPIGPIIMIGKIWIMVHVKFQRFHLLQLLPAKTMLLYIYITYFESTVKFLNLK